MSLFSETLIVPTNARYILAPDQDLGKSKPQPSLFVNKSNVMFIRPAIFNAYAQQLIALPQEAINQHPNADINRIVFSLSEGETPSFDVTLMERTLNEDRTVPPIDTEVYKYQISTKNSDHYAVLAQMMDDITTGIYEWFKNVSSTAMTSGLGIANNIDENPFYDELVMIHAFDFITKRKDDRPLWFRQLLLIGKKVPMHLMLSQFSKHTLMSAFALDALKTKTEIKLVTMNRTINKVVTKVESTRISIANSLGATSTIPLQYVISERVVYAQANSVAAYNPFDEQ